VNLFDDLLQDLPTGEIEDAFIGLHWTAVVVNTAGERRCGLSSTLSSPHVHGKPDIPDAGQLHSISTTDAAQWVYSQTPTQRCLGMATINALLPRHPEAWSDINAADVIVKNGADKRVALIGHFPFVPDIKDKVGRLDVLELDPRPGDLPASAAADILPRADVVAITSMTLLNHTFDDLMALCSPEALTIILGPTTPLVPKLYRYGPDMLSGSIVTNIDAVTRVIRQGGNFRQAHRAGIRLVTMTRPGLAI
jgi:uncharacterized protein (DUF4213/DUF364 family)